MKKLLRIALGLFLFVLLILLAGANTQAVTINNGEQSSEKRDPYYGMLKPTDIFIPDFFDWNSLEAKYKTHATVVGGPHGFLSGRQFDYLGNPDFIKKLTKTAHDAGVKYIAYSNSDVGFDPEAAVMDIDGKVIYNWMSGNVPTASIHNPKTKQTITEWYKRAVDTNADMIVIDTYTVNYDIAQLGNGDFSSFTMKAFRDYLTARYSLNDLKKMGIDSIDNFDYGEFIWQKYYSTYKSGAWADIPLYRDFLDFELKSSLDFWRDAIAETRAYAASKGQKIYFAVNAPDNDINTGLLIADYLDYFLNEYTFSYPPDSKTIPVYKLFQALGKPLATIPNAGFSAELLSRPDLAELMKIYTAEAYSSRGFTYVPYANNAWDLNKQFKAFTAPDIEKLYSYYDFIDGNSIIYDSLKSSARIGVLYSYPSIKQSQSGKDNFWGLSNLLLDAHLQYDVLFAGDNLLIQDRFTIEDLRRYDTVILPGAAGLSTKQLDLLLSYVKTGGNIIVFGETEIEYRDQPANLFTAGVHGYGTGQFAYYPENIGEKYLLNQTDGQNLTDTINSFAQAEITTDADKNAALAGYWKDDTKTHIIHLINYDYDTSAMRFKAKENVEIKVKLNHQLMGQELGVYYVSPDFTDLRELDFTFENGVLRFKIPALDTYGVAVVGKKGKFEAAWQILKLKNYVSEIREPGIIKDSQKQLEIAESAYAEGRYDAAAKTARQALAGLEKIQAETVLSRGKATITRWERSGRTYNLETAVKKLQAAGDCYAAGDYRSSLRVSEEVMELLEFTLDGQPDDWEGIKPLPLTITEKSSDEKPHIENMRITNDQDDLYLFVKLTNAGAEPNLELNLIVNGANGRIEGKIFANNYQAQISAGGIQQELTKAVKDGLFELKIPLKILGGNQGKIEFAVFSSSGAPHLPPESRVTGDKVKTSYEITYMP